MSSIRALEREEPIAVRNKFATHPWQHALEPLSGSLWLGACLPRPKFAPARPQPPAKALNFGPAITANRPVSSLVAEILRHWPGSWVDRSDPVAPLKASLLNLTLDKACDFLGWRLVWDFVSAARFTIVRYRSVLKHGHDASIRQPMFALTRQQIEHYPFDAVAQGLAWAKTV